MVPPLWTPVLLESVRLSVFQSRVRLSHSDCPHARLAITAGQSRREVLFALDSPCPRSKPDRRRLRAEDANGNRTVSGSGPRRGARDGQQRPSQPSSQLAEFFDRTQEDLLSCVQQRRGSPVVNLRGHHAECLDPNSEKMNRHPAAPPGRRDQTRTARKGAQADPQFPMQTPCHLFVSVITMIVMYCLDKTSASRPARRGNLIGSTDPLLWMGLVTLPSADLRPARISVPTRGISYPGRCPDAGDAQGQRGSVKYDGDREI
jgi:hypothetical protein